MNFLVIQLLVSAAFFVSSLSASSYLIDYSCPGLTGNAKEEFDDLMDTLKPLENSLMNCMAFYRNSKSLEDYKNCVAEIGLPDQLESRFMKGICPISSMKLKIESVARSICIDFIKRKVCNNDNDYTNDNINDNNFKIYPVPSRLLKNFDNDIKPSFKIVPVLGFIVLIIVVALAFIGHYIMIRRQAKTDIVANIEDGPSTSGGFDINADTSNP